ncbi:hypothetical protein M426DRAFT_325788 [Hypoxylon sp. CI-4A]|nr:hypothetical protein M426DRAFT_325788 [Hypoxylon sp. CI-4A]
MPTTRRSGSTNRTAGRQSTLSFNHRVTKPVTKSGKDLDAKPSPLAKEVISVQPDEEPISESEAVKTEVEEEQENEIKTEQPAEKSEAELRAANISGRHIDQYWRRLERERVAKRVHQEELTVAEKVLRYWDVSSQYGPCVGISRVKRWKRADKLGLNPPLEVLAVLQREEAKGAKEMESAHIDQILNSTAVGAV